MGERQKQAQINSKFPAFTIIEVVLVLAIAGLIFLMVFIALPALQRNQRDTQRKNDMSRLSDTEGHITVSAGRRCPSSNSPTNNTYQMITGKPSDAAVIVVLETGGFYCLDSQ